MEREIKHVNFHEDAGKIGKILQAARRISRSQKRIQYAAELLLICAEIEFAILENNCKCAKSYDSYETNIREKLRDSANQIVETFLGRK